MMNCMKEFKVNNEVKTSLCRELKATIKRELANNYYIEVAVMYNVNKEEFWITQDTFSISKLEYEGNVCYKTITANKQDIKDITIKNLIAQVF